MTNLEKELIKFYLDWVNDFLTMPAMAEHYCLPEHEVNQLIAIGRVLHERNAQRIKDTKLENKKIYINLD